MDDPLTLRGSVDLTTRFGLEPGCRIGRGRLLCTPAYRAITSTPRPTLPIAGRALLDSRICYKVRCSRPHPPDQGVTDEFGTRLVKRLKPKLVCTPAVLGPPLPLRDTLDHLKCYATRDPVAPQAVVEAIAAPGEQLDTCHLSRSRLFCTSAATSNLQVNVSPLLDLGAGSTAGDDHVCYRMSCDAPAVPAQVVSDRFGSRTVTELVPRLLCSPAPRPATVTTSTVTTTTATTTTLPAGTEQGLVCQRAIEAGGMAYAGEMLGAIEDCAAPSQLYLLDACLTSGTIQQRLSAAESEWGADMTAACGGVDLRSHLGYLESCPPPCTATSAGVAGVRACLGCRIRATLTEAARVLYANRPVRESACHAALGHGGVAALRATLQDVDRCTQQPGATSVAACFAPALAAWRAQAETACAGIDVFQTLGYRRTCSGLPPVFPGFCASEARPCTFPDTGVLSGPGDDLLDCLGCQTEEAVLAIARDVHGANLCCAGGSCDRVLTRFACREATGTPVRYRIDSLATGPVQGPHGVAVGLDGAFYIADSGSARALKVVGTTVTVVGTTPPFPTGIAADAAGNVYVTNRCNHTITKIAPGGATSIFAGTPGTPGSSGDGGPAAAALITAPDGITVDPAGNVYFTESTALSFGCAARGPANAEHVRVVDSAGNIHLWAGAGPYGPTGEGGPALAAGLGLPYGLRWAGGALLIGEAGLQRVLRVAGGMLTRVAGRPISAIGAHSGYGGPAANARFYQNCGVGLDPDGNVVIAPMTDNRVALVDRLGSVITIAGTGRGSSSGSPSGDGGLALLAQAGCPEDVDVGPDGRIYFSDLQASRIRVLTREPF
jgi:sugar lactone lactonase YvrE